MNFCCHPTPGTSADTLQYQKCLIIGHEKKYRQQRQVLFVLHFSGVYKLVMGICTSLVCHTASQC